MNSKLRALTHITDVCVIGGGIGGMFAAISAARNGAKVVLMHDRPGEYAPQSETELQHLGQYPL